MQPSRNEWKKKKKEMNEKEPGQPLSWALWAGGIGFYEAEVTLLLGTCKWLI